MDIDGRSCHVDPPCTVRVPYTPFQSWWFTLVIRIVYQTGRKGFPENNIRDAGQYCRGNDRWEHSTPINHYPGIMANFTLFTELYVVQRRLPQRNLPALSCINSGKTRKVSDEVWTSLVISQINWCSNSDPDILGSERETGKTWFRNQLESSWDDSPQSRRSFSYPTTETTLRCKAASTLGEHLQCQTQSKLMIFPYHKLKKTDDLQRLDIKGTRFDVDWWRDATTE